ncbi:hypothetical protein HF576_01800 [Microbacterium sp. CFH 90308]|uniref:Uncharacterized protein n=1 Tax=Microbacterium salsuginis TaxID=2722803 RepID=A0ABX1K6G2_9MICO|nr:hypothetical protein [Microbacterium sp. CFH 90308]NLP82572.1 hypothetical protein [Microbacterium sp. CFH 90308]
MPSVLRIPGTLIQGVPTPKASTLLQDVSAGPLVLIYPGSPFAPLESLPAVSGPVANLAAELAAATIGGDPGSPTITNAIAPGSVKMKAELTAKGGIHVMNSLSAQASPYEPVDISLGSAELLAFINANPTHDYYLGAWYRVTRIGPYASNPHHFAGLQKGNPVGTAGDRWLTVGPTSTSSQAYAPTSASGLRLGPVERRDGSGGAYTFFAGIGTTDAPASFVALNRLVRLGAASIGQVNGLSSIVVYRLYLEDLTASGRSFADVAAEDHDEYVAEILTPGGVYYGDSWSNPATVLP